MTYTFDSLFFYRQKRVTVGGGDKNWSSTLYATFWEYCKSVYYLPWENSYISLFVSMIFLKHERTDMIWHCTERSPGSLFTLPHLCTCLLYTPYTHLLFSHLYTCIPLHLPDLSTSSLLVSTLFLILLTNPSPCHLSPTTSPHLSPPHLQLSHPHHILIPSPFSPPITSSSHTHFDPFSFLINTPPSLKVPSSPHPLPPLLHLCYLYIDYG